MKQVDRHAVYEGVALCLAGFGVALAVPALMNAHDSIAVIAAFFLILAWAGWGSFFVYRQLERSK